MFSRSGTGNDHSHNSSDPDEEPRSYRDEYATPGHDTTPSAPTTANMAPLVRTATRGNATRAYWIGLVVGVVVAVATALLVLQNSRSTRLEWLGWDFLAPLWLILLIAVAAGAVLLTLAVFLIARTRHRNASRRTAVDRLHRLTEQPDPTGTHQAPTEQAQDGPAND